MSGGDDTSAPEDEYPGPSPDEIEFQNRYFEDSFFLRSLEHDVVDSEELVVLRKGDNFSRRTFVRTVFAEIEGLAASAIDWARYYAAEDSFCKHMYTTAERIVLLGTSARLDGHGRPELEPTKRYETKATIRFALSLVGRGANHLPTIDYSGVGWSALQKAFDLRNRLMHPKVAADLELTDADLEAVRIGRSWFMSTYKSLEAALQRKQAAEFSEKFQEWTHRQKERGDDL